MEARAKTQAAVQATALAPPQEARTKEQHEDKVMPGKGLYANIHAKRKRITAGSGEKMRKPGSKGAPTAAAFRKSAKTAKKKK